MFFNSYFILYNRVENENMNIFEYFYVHNDQRKVERAVAVSFGIRALCQYAASRYLICNHL